MHKTVLGGVAALALLAVATGAPGRPVASGRIVAAGMACPVRMAMLTTGDRPLLVSDYTAATQTRKLLVSDGPLPAAGVRHC